MASFQYEILSKYLVIGQFCWLFVVDDWTVSVKVVVSVSEKNCLW